MIKLQRSNISCTINIRVVVLFVVSDIGTPYFNPLSLKKGYEMAGCQFHSLSFKRKLSIYAYAYNIFVKRKKKNWLSNCMMQNFHL